MCRRHGSPFQGLMQARQKGSRNVPVRQLNAQSSSKATRRWNSSGVPRELLPRLLRQSHQEIVVTRPTVGCASLSRVLVSKKDATRRRGGDTIRGALNASKRIGASRGSGPLVLDTAKEGERMNQSRRLAISMLGPIVAIVLVSVSTRLTADRRPGSGRFELLETTIPAVQSAIRNDIITADQLVAMYQARLPAYDGKTTATHLNSDMHLNARAVKDAREGDGGRAKGHQKGPLFGIPIILKDNVDTKDMPTTAGSVAFAGSVPRSDAFVARKLLDAGAIIIGKATMTEF